MHKDYAALCNTSTVELTSEFLFEELSKLTKDISEVNKLMRKVGPRHYASSRGDMYVRLSGYGLCQSTRPFLQITKVKGRRASQCHINVAEICEAINAKMTPLFNCDVHSLIDLQKRWERLCHNGKLLQLTPLYVNLLLGWQVNFKPMLYPPDIIKDPASLTINSRLLSKRK